MEKEAKRIFKNITTGVAVILMSVTFSSCEKKEKDNLSEAQHKAMSVLVGEFEYGGSNPFPEPMTFDETFTYQTLEFVQFDKPREIEYSIPLEGKHKDIFLGTLYHKSKGKVTRTEYYTVLYKDKFFTIGSESLIQNDYETIYYNSDTFISISSIMTGRYDKYRKKQK